MKNDWKPIYGYEEFYEINTDAVIRSFDRDAISKTGAHIHIKGRIMRPYVNENGYIVIRLTKNGKSKIERVHRLMMLTFVGPDPDRPVVNHKNGNKLDPRLDNLEWTTSSENNIHAIKTGLRSYDKIRREYHVTIDDLDFTILGAKAAAIKLHQNGYFTHISTEALRAGLRNCAKDHRLYFGVLKIEATDDRYNEVKPYHNCGKKGRHISATFMLSTGIFMLKAYGPARILNKLIELNVWPSDLDRYARIKLIGEAAKKHHICYGVEFKYIDN